MKKVDKYPEKLRRIGISLCPPQGTRWAMLQLRRISIILMIESQIGTTHARGYSVNTVHNYLHLRLDLTVCSKNNTDMIH